VNSLVEVLKVFRVITKETQESSRPTMHQLLLHVQVAQDELGGFRRPVGEGGLFGVEAFITETISSFERRVVRVFKGLCEAQLASFLSPNSKGIELEDEVRSYVRDRIFLFCENECNTKKGADAPALQCHVQPPQVQSKLMQKIASLTASKNGEGITAQPLKTAETELKIWDETPLHPTFSADVCEFWKGKTDCPSLQKLVRKALSRPSSSAESERVFSKTGLVYSDQRSLLSPKNVGMLITVASALKSSAFQLDYP
jgi:hypothetical protein